MIGFQEVIHLRLAAFVTLQKLLLILWDRLAAGWIWICKRWIRKQRLECAIPYQLGLAQNLDLIGVERQQVNVFQQIVVVSLAHRFEWPHSRQTLFQPIGKTV